jgi:hypothetical protein
MNKVFSGLAFLGTLISGCSSGQDTESTAGVGRLRIEVACSSDSDCPGSFECESETEHGATTTFCQSHDEAQPDGSGAQCPAGYELEVEHGTSFCKPHGGDDDNGGAEPGDDNGGNGAEPGDDNGGNGAEPGDDNGGGAGGEPGDDHGGKGKDDTTP